MLYYKYDLKEFRFIEIRYLLNRHPHIPLKDSFMSKSEPRIQIFF